MGPLCALCVILIATVSVVHCHVEEDENAVESFDINQSILSSDWKKVYDYWKDKGSFVCPAIYGRYAHPKECSLYYECRFSVPHLMQCDRGKLYDEKKEKCKDKKRVKCNKSGRDDDDSDEHGKDEEEERDKNQDFACPYIWGSYPHPIDCSKYFVCLYKVPNLFQCYGTDLYDERIKRCIDKRKVKCGNRLDRDQMKTSKKPTTVHPTTPIEIKTSGIVTSTAVPSTIEEIKTTKNPTTVNPTTLYEYKTTVVVTSTIVPSTTEEVNKFACPFPYGKFPEPSDCSQFYACEFSIPTLHKCPHSTLYDERKEECLEDKRVRCGDRPGGVGDDDEEEKEKAKKEKFRCPYIWGTFPHPDDCSKYMICIYNVPTIFSCRKNELFEAYYRRCFPADEITCDYRINPDDLTSLLRTTTTFLTTTKTPTTSTTPISTTSQTTPTTTPTVTTVLPTTIPPSTNKPKPNTPPTTDCNEDDLDCIEEETGDIKHWFDCPKRYGHFPHGSSYRLFIRCDNWIPFVKRCADETAFSPKFLACMWIGTPIPKVTKKY